MLLTSEKSHETFDFESEINGTKLDVMLEEIECLCINGLMSTCCIAIGCPVFSLKCSLM